ncbi:hypothetical protein BAZSYMA_ACONTIG53101_1 [Bathymodiolus azoricus thioautotrophic gill symbiont]|uniref:Uncharacterized protein n=1 Tax=Bathymodiolus azoricus thioautotrophic gill symbiont TaxID=235205 RepID=A0A1H6N536_9GAMM|nr:hypothetical protein BAZSYMA_ACONTIG53101_1 [Bathymodiolus azoricus thioautotrophic gill symbiont]
MSFFSELDLTNKPDPAIIVAASTPISPLDLALPALKDFLLTPAGVPPPTVILYF